MSREKPAAVRSVRARGMSARMLQILRRRLGRAWTKTLGGGLWRYALALVLAGGAVAPGAALAGEPVMGKWTTALYGFVEDDNIWDSTQSFNDLAGNGAVARPNSYAAEHDRMTFAVRNSRIGFKLGAPEEGGVRAGAVAEMDFFGNQPNTPNASTPPGLSESAYFTSPGFRIRHFFVKIEDPTADLLAGQTWHLFGWQGMFQPNTVEIQGIPGELYGRTPQVRLSHNFKTDAINTEVAVAGMRPVMRESGTPDGEAGVRWTVDSWKGIHTTGAAGTSVDPLAFGVSGIARRFALPSFNAAPQTTQNAVGSGVAVDALLPIVPVNGASRANALTLTAEYVRGTGIADQFTGLTGGVGFPSLATPPGATYAPDVDAGLAVYDKKGNLHTIDWDSWIAGIQYYTPFSDDVWVALNVSQMHSANADPFGAGNKVFTRTLWADANVFYDMTKAVRLGVEYARFDQTYADQTNAVNHRVQFSAFYLF